MSSRDKPAFEVVNPHTGEAFRIWADGRIEGFEKYGATLITNRIPQMVARQQYEALAMVNDDALKAHQQRHSTVDRHGEA